MSSEPNDTPDTETDPTPRDPRDGVIHGLVAALVIVSAIALVLAATVIFLAVRGTPVSPTTPATPTGTTPTTAAPVYGAHYVTVNPGAAKPGAIVVEIHSDYQCPWCQRAEEIYGAALEQASANGDIDLRIHVRTIIGDNLLKNDSSERAARAALCADQAGHFWAYHSTIFANQPAKEGDGFTDEQLRVTFAAQSGITGQALTDFQACYDTGATAAAVTQMEQEGFDANIRSTPTFYVNGRQVNFDLQANAATITPITLADLMSGLQSVAG